jgi:hypothetical protein
LKFAAWLGLEPQFPMIDSVPLSMFRSNVYRWSCVNRCLRQLTWKLECQMLEAIVSRWYGDLEGEKWSLTWPRRSTRPRSLILRIRLTNMAAPRACFRSYRRDAWGGRPILIGRKRRTSGTRRSTLLVPVLRFHGSGKHAGLCLRERRLVHMRLTGTSSEQLNCMSRRISPASCLSRGALDFRSSNREIIGSARRRRKPEGRPDTNAQTNDALSALRNRLIQVI